MTFVTFAALGSSSLVVQLLLMRELLGSFYGNEFFINLSLGAWLFWTAAGTFRAGGLIRQQSAGKAVSGLILTYAALCLVLPLEILVIRAAPAWTGSAGEIPDLFWAVIAGFFVLAPAAFLFGLQFPLALAASGTTPEKTGEAANVNRAYVYETAGFILGGIVFGYWLVDKNELSVAGICCGLNCVLIHRWTRRFKIKRALVWTSLGLSLGIFLCLVVPAFSKPLAHASQSLRFPGQVLSVSVNSVYGQISVTKTGAQTNFYESGCLLGPADDIFQNELLAHLPLSFCARTGKILVIGNGAGGLFREILKYAPERIVGADLDPSFAGTVREYLPASLRETLNDPRIEIAATDPRAYLQGTGETFDAVILNLPPPSTGLINRFYTLEFFRRVKKHLSPGGIVSVALPYSPSTPNAALQNMNACVYKALEGVFPSVTSFTGETNILVAGISPEASENAFARVLDRFRERGLETRFFTADFLRYRLINSSSGTGFFSYEKIMGIKINRDLVPAGYGYATLYFLSRFHPSLAEGLDLFSGKELFFFLAICAAALLAAFFSKNRSPETRLKAAMAVAGFSLMFVQSILILMFQTYLGNLYYRIALLLSALMAGMALGSFAGMKISGTARTLRHGVGIAQTGLAGYSAWLIFFLGWAAKTELLFFAAAAVPGLLVGFEFAVINRRYLDTHTRETGRSGVIYAYDLAGSCLGILLAPAVFIPVLGVIPSLGFLTLLNLLAVGLTRL